MDYITDQVLSQLPFYDDLRPYITQAKPYIRHSLNTVTYITTSILLPLINQLIAILSSSEQNPIVTIGILLGTLIVSFYVLGWVKRQIFFWIGLAVQLAFWGSVMMLGFVCWQLGPQYCLDALVGWYQGLQVTNGQAGRARGSDAFRSRGGGGGGYKMGSKSAGTGHR